ncbi:MAG TPA: porphobilinogen synthase [Acidimicrobiia bacterium]|nr:porphobilinogen synthase [Acidimicrobiia bacterium]
MSGFPVVRPRRLRMSSAMRRAVAETRLDPARFVLPVFVVPGEGVRRPIESMPGHAQLSVDQVTLLAKEAEAAGIGGLLFFGVPDHKDEIGSSAWDPSGPVPRAIEAVSTAAPDLIRWADVCLCEYTSHGHCGPLRGEVVDNDSALPLLARAATIYADAGAEVVAPSDMMDGRVGAIRSALDERGHSDTVICSYAVKYASAYYGPFRDAAGSTPAFGDRRSHQMDPANVREAIREASLDVDEGADLVMVKPAGPYLDVVRAVRETVDVPVVAYQVSGEMAMIEAAAAKGWIERDRVIIESLTGIVRAGAGIVLTYFALDAARLIEETE